jgi:hypothetical protein
MRKLWILGALASSLVLAACGATATINTAVTSIGSSANLQVHLTVNASGAGTAPAQGALHLLSVDMSYSSTDGSALSSSNGHVNSQFTLNSGNQTLVDLRQVDTNIYVNLNIAALASIPGVKVTASQLAAAQLLFGGRWFEVSEGFLTSFLPTTTVNTAVTNNEVAAARAVLDSLSALISRTPYTTLAGGGFSQTGTLNAVVKAVLPAIKGLTNSTAVPSSGKGTYTIAFTMSGPTATGVSLKISAPNGSQGNASVGVDVTLSHAATPVVAPTGATVITRAMVAQIRSQIRGGALG